MRKHSVPLAQAVFTGFTSYYKLYLLLILAVQFVLYVLRILVFNGPSIASYLTGYNTEAK